MSSRSLQIQHVPFKLLQNPARNSTSCFQLIQPPKGSVLVVFFACGHCILFHGVFGVRACPTLRRMQGKNRQRVEMSKQLANANWVGGNGGQHGFVGDRDQAGGGAKGAWGMVEMKGHLSGENSFFSCLVVVDDLHIHHFGVVGGHDALKVPVGGDQNAFQWCKLQQVGRRRSCSR